MKDTEASHAGHASGTDWDRLDDYDDEEMRKEWTINEQTIESN